MRLASKHVGNQKSGAIEGDFEQAMNTQRRTKRRLGFMAKPPSFGTWLVAMLIFLLSALWLDGCIESLGAPPAVTPAQTEKVRAETQVHKRVHDRNDEADKKIEEARAKRLKELEAFFEEKRAGVDGFVEDALGWYALAYWSYSWIDGGEALHNYLNERFHAHLFTEEDLANKIREVVAGFLKDVEDIENDMLTKLKEDLNDLPEARKLEYAVVKEAINKFKTKLQKESRKYLVLETSVDVITICISEYIASIIVKHLGKRLGIQVCVQSSVKLGSIVLKIGNVIVTLVLSVVIDYAIDWLVRQVYDPKQDFKDALNDSITELQSAIIAGYKDPENGTWKNGLDQEMRDFILERSKIRERVILEQLEVQP